MVTRMHPGLPLTPFLSGKVQRGHSVRHQWFPDLCLASQSLNRDSAPLRADYLRRVRPNAILGLAAHSRKTVPTAFIRLVYVGR